MPLNSLSPIKIVIPDHRTISWNKLYSSKHWTARKALADEIHTLVKYTALSLGIEPVNRQISIKLTAYSDRPIDPDNLCAKLYIDGLKEVLIEDDTSKFIKEVILESVKAKTNYLEIEII